MVTRRSGAAFLCAAFAVAAALAELAVPSRRGPTGRGEAGAGGRDAEGGAGARSALGGADDGADLVVTDDLRGESLEDAAADGTRHPLPGAPLDGDRRADDAAVAHLRRAAREVARPLEPAVARGGAGERREAIDARRRRPREDEAQRAEAETPKEERRPGTGLLGEYYKFPDTQLTDFPSLKAIAPAARRIDPVIDFRGWDSFKLPFQPRNIAVRWRGFIFAEEEGIYTFVYGTDDGGWLLIDGATVIAIPGLHPYVERSAEVHLTRGYHAIEARMFQNESAVDAVLAWVPPLSEPGIVPSDVLYPPDALSSEAAPRIREVTPPAARMGETVRIVGEGFPTEGDPAAVTFDGVLMRADAFEDRSIAAVIPPGVDRGDIVVGVGESTSLGYPYETGDVFGLLGEYTQAPAEMRSLADAPPEGSPGAFRRVDERIDFRWHGAFRLPFAPRRFVARWRGALYVREPGVYAFRLTSDDGSALWIDRAAVVENDGLHAMLAREGAVDLAEGFHEIALDLIQNDGGAGIVLEWAPPGRPFEVVPRRALYAPREVALRRVPEIEGIEPPEGRPGDLVEIRGRGFLGDGRGERVTFHGAQAVVESASPIRLVVRVPERARTGPVLVQSGELVSAPADFRVLGRGLLGAYYKLDEPLSAIPPLDGRVPTFERLDPRIRFGEDYSFSLPFEAECFAARWRGEIEAPAQGIYRFELESDDGSRLLIDGRPVIDHDGLHVYAGKAGEVALEKGRHQIAVEYFENGGFAAIRLFWTVPGRNRDEVPESALYPPE